MNKVFPGCFVMLLLLLPLTGQSGEQDDIAAVRGSADLWIKYYEADDLDQLMTLYTPDAFVALHGKKSLKGIEQIRAFFEPGMGQSETNFELDVEEIQIHGDTAHLLSKYWLTAISKNDGSIYRDAGRSLLIYKRDQNNQWKIYLDIDQATPDVTWNN